ncbi:MAG: hypothetical protein ACYCTV_11040 [Leptospirales bacterium]
MLAVLSGDGKMAQSLLDQGADPGLTDCLGRMAFHYALLMAMQMPGFSDRVLPGIYERRAPLRSI